MGEALPTALREVTDAEIETFWREGVVCLRESCRRTGSRWSSAESIDGSDRRRASASRSSGRNSSRREDVLVRISMAGPIIGRPTRMPTVRLESPLPAIIGRLLRATKVNLYEDSILVKEPGAIEKTMFHQDLPYFTSKGLRSARAGFPRSGDARDGLAPLREGSHAWKKLYRRTISSRGARFQAPRERRPGLSRRQCLFSVRGSPRRTSRRRDPLLRDEAR